MYNLKLMNVNVNINIVCVCFCGMSSRCLQGSVLQIVLLLFPYFFIKIVNVLYLIGTD
jgi:hypothetical protein